MVRWVVYVCHPHMASRHPPGIRSGWTCVNRRSSLIDGHGALEERNWTFLNELIATDQVAQDAVPWAQVRAHVVTNFFILMRLLLSGIHLNKCDSPPTRPTPRLIDVSVIWLTPPSLPLVVTTTSIASWLGPMHAVCDRRRLPWKWSRTPIRVRWMLQSFGWITSASVRTQSRLGLDRPGVEPMDIGSVHPPTLPSNSGRQGEVPRLGLHRPGVALMDIGSVYPPTLPPMSPPLNEVITKVLRGQERL